MADQRGGGISWTETTWNPVRGCSRVSEGCRFCYAERVAARFSGPGQPYDGLAKNTAAGPRWTGAVRLVPEHLDDPLRWKRSRMVFVNSMSDLLHEGLTFGEIAAVFGVMAAAPRHTFQVLTKRPGRMLAFLDDLERQVMAIVSHHPDPDRRPVAHWFRTQTVGAAEDLLDRHIVAEEEEETLPGPWPLPNVWLGVSVEDQKTADERVPLLLQTPAAVRWVSYEPALGPVDFKPWLVCQECAHPATEHDQGGWCADCGGPDRHRRPLDWIVCGGESGPGARPMHPAWARSVRDQCKAAGVPFHFKQWGHFRPAVWLGNRFDVNLNDHHWRLIDAAGHDHEEPVAGIDRPEYLLPVGKKTAGRLLDGRTWDEFPAQA